MKKRILSLLLALVMVIGLMPAAAAAGTFSDVPSTYWAYDYVERVYREGLMNGTTASTFSPDATLNRGMFVTILARFAKADVDNSQPSGFADVPAGKYCTGAVAWAAKNGITSGTSKTTFSPEQAVTRQEMAVFLYRTMKLLGYDCAQKGDLAAYTDCTQVGGFAADAMAWAVGAEVLNGFSGAKLCPREKATRASVAAIMCRVLDYSEDKADDGDNGNHGGGSSGGSSGGGSTVVVPPAPEKYTATFHVTPADAVITLTDGEGNAVAATSAGKYSVENGASYAWTVSAEGYETQTGSFTASSNQSITVNLKKLPVDPEPAKTVTISFYGENGYAKYEGKKVTSIQVSTEDAFVEFGIYGEYDNGYETATVTASSGKLVRAGNTCILSDFDEDVTVNFTTRFRTLTVDFSIANYLGQWIETPQYVTWGQKAQLPTILRPGYHVTTWYTDEEKTQAYDFDSVVTEDLTLYGTWEINVYTVTFMVDGEVYATAPAKYSGYVAAADYPTNPTKDDYVFEGWYYDEEYTTPYVRSSSKITGDTTVYAKWVEAQLNYVYLDGRNGKDENSGVTAADAVKTFAKAKSLLAGAAYKEIRICGTVTVSKEETWDLSEYPDAVVLRDETYTSYLMSVTGKLTLQNITIDGGSTRWTSNKGYIAFNCTNGSVIMNEGTTFRNHISTSGAGVGYLNGATVEINDGVKIYDNQGKYAGVFECSSSSANPTHITMNGGEIYDNTAIYKATAASSTPAGVLKLCAGSSTTAGNSTMVMNGGKIYNNKALNDGSGTFGVGAIFLYNRASFTMNGGEIYGNVGVNAGAIQSMGVAAKQNSDKEYLFTENYINLKGGSIRKNTATALTGEIDLRTYSNLVLDGSVFDGDIWMVKYTTSRRPVQLTAALTKPLNLTVEAVVYGETLVSGTADYALTEDDLKKVALSNDLGTHYQLVLDEDQNMIFVDTTQVIGTQIWLSPAGNDSNDGLTEDTPVATFAKAKALLQKNQSATGDNVIMMLPGAKVADCYVITQDETWSLAGIPNAYLQVANYNGSGYLVSVQGATLTLEDITIDGNRYYETDGKYVSYGIRVEWVEDGPSKLVMNSGTTLRNFGSGGVYSYGGIVEVNEGTRYVDNLGVAVYGTGMIVADGTDKRSFVTVNGGTFSGNYHALEITGGSVLTVNDGLFENNISAANPGGAVIIADNALTETIINGGTFRNNAMVGTGNMSLGAVYFSRYASKLTINGGTFSNNTCALNPNAGGVAFSANPGSVTLGAGANTADLPFYFAKAADAGALQVVGAVAGTVKLSYAAAPAAGTVIAQGVDYTLTQADLAKFTCTNEGVTFTLDTANNQIVVAG